MEENKTTTAPEDKAMHLDEAYVIAKIEQIMGDSAHLRKFLQILEVNAMSGEVVIGVGNMIEARERTNQEMISFLRHIVNCKL